MSISSLEAELNRQKAINRELRQELSERNESAWGCGCWPCCWRSVSAWEGFG